MTDTTNTATIRVVADASGVEAGLRPAVAAAKKAGDAIGGIGDGAAAATTKVESSARNIIASVQRTTMAMEAGGKTTAAYYEMLASQRGVDPATLAPYIAKLREVEQAQGAAGHALEEFSFKSAAAKREVLVLMHELSQGNFKRFGGSMMVIAEQTGAAGLLFSAAGIAAIGMGAAAIGAGVMIAKGAAEQKAMNDALIMTGGYAGVTSDSLNAMAHAAVTAGGSISVAKEAVTALAGSGKFTADQIGAIAEAAVAMEHATGQSVDKTIEQFQSLAAETSGDTLRATEAVSKAALKLDDQYHFLTESIYEQIRAFEKEGEQKAASAVATDALAKATKDRADEMIANLGYVARAWNGIKEAIGGVGDALGNLGKKATPGIEVDKYKSQLLSFDASTRFRHAQHGTDPEKLTPREESERADIVKKLTAAVIAKNKVDADAITQGNLKIAQSEAMHAASRIEDDDVKLQKKSMTELQIALKEYAKDRAKIAAVNRNSPLLAPDAVKAHIAALTKAHTPAPAKGSDDRASLLQAALTTEKTALDGEKAIYDERDKMLTLYHSKFGMSDDEYYAGRANARAEYIAAEAIAFAKESALARASEREANNPAEIAAAKAKYVELLRAHQKFIGEMSSKAVGDSANQLIGSGWQTYGQISTTVSSAGAATLKTLDEQIEKQKEHNAEIGKTKEQIELARQAQEDSHTKQLQSDADYLRDGLAKWDLDDKSRAIFQIRLTNLDSEITKRRTIASLHAQGAALEAAAASRQLVSQAIQDWKNVGASIAQSLSGAFAAGGKAAGGMFKAYADGQAAQLQAQKDLAHAKDNMVKDSPEQIAAITRAQNESAQAQLKSYGDMAGAAQGFFDKNSSGYAAMHKISEVFYIAETAMALATLPAKLAAGAATMFAQSGWGGFAGVAAMAAVVAGFGVAVSGGGSGLSAADRQAANGTGTIAGDPTAKSDSIAKSLSAIDANTYDGLHVSQGMLSSLQAIEANIGSFAGLLVQGGAINNPNASAGLSSGIGKTGWAQADLTATGAEFGMMIGGPIGAGIGAAVGFIASKIPVIQKLYSSIFGGKQSLDDQGFTMNATTLGQVAASGVNAKTYADVTTSGGWFRGESHDTQTAGIGAQADQQISQIILGIGDTIKQAGAILGLSGNEFDAKLNGFVIDIGKISLKGLSSADQQTAINNAFSKLSDQMTTSAVATITQFSKAGEGALQTLTRVATDYQTVDAVFASFGAAFSQVGMESVAAREKLIDLAGGLSKFTSQADYFFKNILTAGQQTQYTRAAIDPTLAKYGLSTVGPDAVANFAKVAIAMGAMGAAGAQAYTDLMNIAPAFKAVTDVAKGLQDQIDQLTLTAAQQSDAARALLDPADQSLYDDLQQAKAVAQAKSDLVSAYNTESQAMQGTIDRLKSFSLSLHSFVDSLQLGGMSPLNPADKYAAATAQFNDTLSKAQHGDATAQSNLQSAAQAFLTASKAANASNSTYQSDYQKVVAAMDKTASWADTQVSEGQQNLIVLRDQVSQLVTLNNTSLSVVDAINNLAVIMGKGTDSSTNNTAIETLYKEMLGRNADKAGEAYYANLMQQGVSLATIADDIKNSTEYMAHINSLPAGGVTNVTPSTQFGTAAVAAGPGVGGMGAIPDTSVATVTSALTKVYEQALGRKPDAAGLDYWVSMVNGGKISLTGAENDIATSPEAINPPTLNANTLPLQAPIASQVGQTAPQSAQVVAQLASVNTQLATLIANAQQQANNQVDATMTAADNTGSTVATAVKATAQQQAWDANNKVALR